MPPIETSTASSQPSMWPLGRVASAPLAPMVAQGWMCAHHLVSLVSDWRLEVRNWVGSGGKVDHAVHGGGGSYRFGWLMFGCW